MNDSRFYWIDPNEIAVVTDAEPGAWGPGSGTQLSGTCRQGESLRAC